MARLEISITDETREKLEGLASARGYLATEGRRTGEPNLTRMITALVDEETERSRKAPTLGALARTDPDRARRLVRASLELAPTIAGARDLIGAALLRSGPIDHNDWQNTIKALDMRDEIKRGGKAAE